MKVGVLGLGSVGSRHARNLSALGHEVIGFDPTPPRSEEEWSRVSSLADAISEAEAVVVATPTSAHAAHACAALESGTPVIVEKPLSVNPADAQQVATLAHQHGVACAVAMNLRFHPAIRTLHSLVRGGTLGEIRYVRASAGSDLRTWRPGSDYRLSYSARASLGGGVVRDAIHELDYLTWLLGPAVSVSAEVGHVSDLEIDVEDLAVALVRLSSGALASVDLTYIDPVYRRGCLLVGSNATAHWDWTRGTIEIGRPDADIETLDVRADVADTYVAEMHDFLTAVTTGGSPCCSAQEGVEMVRLADALLRSARAGRRITL